MTTYHRFLALLLLAWCWQGPRADDTESPMDRTLREKLVKPIRQEFSFSRKDAEPIKGVSTSSPDLSGPLQDIMEELTREFAVKFTIDPNAFDTAGTENLEKRQVRLSSIPGASLERVLRLLLVQVVTDSGLVGDFRIRAGTIELTTRVPMPLMNLAPSKALQKTLDKPITIEATADIEESLKELLGYLQDRSGTPVLIDTAGFAAIGIADVGDQVVRLPALQNVKASEALQRLAVQVGNDDYVGGIVVYDGFVMLTPQHAQLAARKPLTAAQLDALGAALKSANPDLAMVAMQALLQAPSQALPWLHDTMPPLPALDAKVVARLLADLGSEQFAVRQKAMGDLEKSGPAVLVDLRKHLANDPTLDVRVRLESLIRRLASEETRSLRYVVLLERCNSPEARQLLETLAKGAADARLTAEAKSAIQRLGK
jgi:hypothetical protein